MNRSRNSILDIIRGLAALEVALSHVRAFVFDGFNQVEHASILVKIFYFLTGFGHQSVVIFFVLSGYLVGGAVLAAPKEGFFLRYSVQRLSRLWIVLLPCLVATAVLDTSGYHVGGAQFLNGNVDSPRLIFPAGQAVHTDVHTFLDNAFFLQTIIAPVYGDNVPLWSLANEFWYYVIFPLLFFGIRKDTGRRGFVRVLFIGAGIAILIALPLGIRLGFVSWLAGAAIAACGKYGIDKIFRSKWYGIPAVLAGVGAFVYGRYVLLPDYLLGLAFAAVLPVFLRCPSPPKLVALVSAWLADFSYTLYLAHFPMVAFMWYALFDSQQLQPSWRAAGRFGFIVFALIAYSYGLSLLFERNTDRLRRFVMRHLPGQESNRALAQPVSVAAATNEDKNRRSF
jgi:peptidoglycan/LPS O-acetylase OafA/YrhL